MTTIQASIDRFTADPAAGRTAPKVTARLDSGRAELAAGPFTWGCDLPPGLGGTNESRARRRTCSARSLAVPSRSSTTPSPRSSTWS
jgi:hypothetical protein